MRYYNSALCVFKLKFSMPVFKSCSVGGTQKVLYGEAVLRGPTQYLLTTEYRIKLECKIKKIAPKNTARVYIFLSTSLNGWVLFFLIIIFCSAIYRSVRSQTWTLIRLCPPRALPKCSGTGANSSQKCHPCSFRSH